MYINKRVTTHIFIFKTLILIFVNKLIYSNFWVHTSPCLSVPEIWTKLTKKSGLIDFFRARVRAFLEYFFTPTLPIIENLNCSTIQLLPDLQYFINLVFFENFKFNSKSHDQMKITKILIFQEILRMDLNTDLNFGIF